MSEPKENKVVIDDSEKKQPSEFFDMNADCWLKIFDNLSLRDILSMSAICQRMLQIGGYYFRQNFHGTSCRVNADSGLWIHYYELEHDDFLRFIDTASIHQDLKHLKHFSSMNLLGSVTTLRLWSINLNADAIGNFEKSLLDNIETVELIQCKIHDDFDGQLFASCPKLKSLKMVDTNSNNLLRCTYPTLTRLEYILCHESAPLFTSFLERNTSIKTLRMNASYLMKIGLNTSAIQLDCLTIEVYLMNLEAIELVNRLKTLHANGFYKKLHLFLGSESKDHLIINEMASFGALEVLITDFYANIRQLTQLKELHLIGVPSDAVTLESIAKKLTNLERLYIDGTVEHLMPFLRHSKALEWIILDSDSRNPLNLCDLNHERVMGGSRRNVRIGLPEELYLSTKFEWKDFNYDLVEITRIPKLRAHFVHH